MVNLRGGLRGLGAALTTLGTKGLEEQQRVAQDRRLLDREMAFATFNQGVRNADLDRGVERGLDEYDRQTPLVAGREEKSLKVREPFAIATQDRTIAAEAARDEREAGQEIERENRGEARETRQEARRFQTWRRQRGITQSDERAHELWRREQGLDSGSRPTRYLENDDTGNYTAMFADGRAEETNVPFVRTGSDDDDEDGTPVTDVLRRLTGGGAPAPSPAPSRTPARTGGRLTPRGGAPVRVSTMAEAQRLPSGTRFIRPDGQIRVRQ